MRRTVISGLAVLGLCCAGHVSATLRPPPPPASRVVPTFTPPPAPLPRPRPEVADIGAYARMLAHCQRYEWQEAAAVARRYVDLADGRDRTDYVIGLLYHLRSLAITSSTDLAAGSLESSRCAGISLHNLMLFFRHQGVPGWETLGRPTRLAYQRGLALDQGDLGLAIVRAGLLTDLGQREEAEQLFAHPPEIAAVLPLDDIINMAYYSAARGDRQALGLWLARAMRCTPEHTQQWAAESDDLDAYRDDAGITSLLTRP